MTAVYYQLVQTVEPTSLRKAAPEGYQEAIQNDNGVWTATIPTNTSGTTTVRYDDENETTPTTSTFQYKVTLNTGVGVDTIVEWRPNNTGIIYNMEGVPVDENYHGIVIKEGKKFVNK